jgi:uncharacterized lipoprotein YddW (UPF0748 family)
MMKRRDFLRVAAGTASAAALGPGLLRADQEPFQRWTWVHGGGDRTPAQWRDQYHRLAEAGFHGVLVGGGDTAAHAQAARVAGLEFHRWIWTLNRSGDTWVRENHPEWFTVSRNGDSSLDHPPYVNYYRWLCPTKEGVRAYLRESMLEVARDPRVGGVHLDYVRHCDVILPRGLWERYDLVQDRELPEFDFCYCETCREAFSAAHGTDPLELPDPPADETWRQFRWDSVTGLVAEIAEAVRGASKPITAAVFPTPSIARSLVRQAWDQWPVDTVMPMLYHAFYEESMEWIGRGIEEGLGAIRARRSRGEPAPERLLAGLYLPALSAQERGRAEEIARAAGADGVSFFEMAGLDL